jgi:hypothetical protein
MRFAMTFKKWRIGSPRVVKAHNELDPDAKTTAQSPAKVFTRSLAESDTIVTDGTTTPDRVNASSRFFTWGHRYDGP